jgi:L-serine/L-threonine ammonia-lyase
VVDWRVEIYYGYTTMFTKPLHINSPLHIDCSTPEQKSLLAGGRIALKFDCLQPGGSFKIRGIGHLCTLAANDGAKGFISSSGGNAGIATAYAASRLALPVKVVVPESTGALAITRLKSLGAEVTIHGAAWDEANAKSLELAQLHDYAHVHPFDHPLLWQGHASLIDEVVAAGCTPDVVIVAVGGGGLLSGVAEGLRRNALTSTEIVAVETEGAASLYASVKEGRLVTLPAITSIAKSLGAKRVSEQALKVMSEFQSSSVVVSDHEACQAVVALADQHRVLVEPACGAAFALLNNPDWLSCYKSKSILVVICGGNGVTSAQVEQWRTPA